MLINPNGFREYDARWLYKKDIDLGGIEDLGKGLGTQIINHTKKINPRVIVGHDYRSYSEEIKSALKNGLISTGCYVEDIDFDTFSENKNFFSFRKSKQMGEKDYGRCISVISLIND